MTARMIVLFCLLGLSTAEHSSATGGMFENPEEAPMDGFGPEEPPSGGEPPMQEGDSPPTYESPTFESPNESPIDFEAPDEESPMSGGAPEGSVSFTTLTPVEGPSMTSTAPATATAPVDMSPSSDRAPGAPEEDSPSSDRAPGAPEEEPVSAPADSGDDDSCQFDGDDNAMFVAGVCECSAGFVNFGTQYCAPDVEDFVVQVQIAVEYTYLTCGRLSAEMFTQQDVEEATAEYFAMDFVDASATHTSLCGFDDDDDAGLLTVSVVELTPEQFVNMDTAGEIADGLEEHMLKEAFGPLLEKVLLSSRAAVTLAEFTTVSVKRVTLTSTCAPANANAAVSFTTAAGDEVCFASQCNNGFGLAAVAGKTYDQCVPTGTRDIVFDPEDDLSSGAIVGLVVGILALIALAVAVVVLMGGKSAPEKAVTNEPIEEEEAV